MSVWLVFFGIFGSAVISFVIISEYFIHGTLNHVSIAIDPKYPELALPSPKGPTLNDPHYKAEIVFRGLRYSTGMVFLGPNDILVAEKESGTVRRIANGAMLQQPLLDVNVSTYGHRGMLGIAVDSSLLKDDNDEWHNSNYNNYYDNDNDNDNNNGTANPNIPTYVFVYYTEAQGQDRDDITIGKEPLGNRLYRYELSNNKLVNPKLLVDLPATPGAIGIGGKVIVGPDNNVYFTIGDVGIDGHHTKAQNVQNGPDADGTSGILRISKDGMPILPGVLGSKSPLNLYYSYGIWNSFGIDFDPVTGNLWDTENGLIFGDEINLVEPGFNSGYNKIDGIWLRGYPIDQTEKHVAPRHPHDLADFNGIGIYHIPQFTWFKSVGPTGIAFFSSYKMGSKYENGVFVGDIINGNIYHFTLDPNRTELLLPTGPLKDKVVNSSDTLEGVIFGKGFGGITEIKVSPYDGYLYVLTFDSSQGTIFKIVPKGHM